MQFPSIIRFHECRLNILCECILVSMDLSLKDDWRVVGFQWPLPPYRSLKSIPMIHSNL